MAAPQRDEEFEHLVAYIRDERGFDFTGYKRPSLQRRIEKRMQEVEIDSFAEYRTYLENHQEEFVSLFNTILINVTSFFAMRSPGTTSRRRSSRASWLRKTTSRFGSGRRAAPP